MIMYVVCAVVCLIVAVCSVVIYGLLTYGCLCLCDGLLLCFCVLCECGCAFCL